MPVTVMEQSVQHLPVSKNKKCLYLSDEDGYKRFFI